MKLSNVILQLSSRSLVDLTERVGKKCWNKFSLSDSKAARTFSFSVPEVAFKVNNGKKMKEKKKKSGYLLPIGLNRPCRIDTCPYQVIDYWLMGPTNGSLLSR